jgi:DDE superfamily endonuclease
MYIDETAANELTIHRRYGWSPKGLPARQITSAKRTQKWSILPLYTYDGFVDWMIVHGSFNGDLFIEFLEQHVIPHTNPYPGPRSVLIMDNAKIHHDEVLKPCRFIPELANSSVYKGCAMNTA